MFKVTLDIFSGRPNPAWLLTWEEGQQLLDRIASGGARIAPYDPYSPQFGIYQGFVLEKAAQLPQNVPAPLADTLAALPASFRVIGAQDMSGEEERWLLKSADELFKRRADLLNGVWSTVELTADFRQPRERGQQQEEIGSAACWIGFNSDFGFWNDNDHDRQNNNCYNYAAGIKTWTFAQPGRAAGQEAQFPFACAGNTNGVSNAAFRDGVMIGCDDLNWNVYLAVRGDGWDYHWWRKIDHSWWGHKPGGTAARGVDFSGRAISDPATSDRGPYNVQCGYYHIPCGDGRWITIR